MLAWSAMVSLSASFVTTGCGPAPTEVSGTVTLDGKPVAKAGLQFFPIAGNGQTSHSFTDENGRYRVTVSPTKMLVTIQATRVVGQEHFDNDPKAPLVNVSEHYLPARYGVHGTSGLVVEPKAGACTTADFELTSASVQP
jgi:hypothetical protein